MPIAQAHPSDVSDTASPTLTLPILDLGPYLHHETGALQRLASELRDALEHIGFFFIINHGIPQTPIDRVFAAASRLHALPLEEKMALKSARRTLATSRSAVAAAALSPWTGTRKPI